MLLLFSESESGRSFYGWKPFPHVIILLSMWFTCFGGTSSTVKGQGFIILYKYVTGLRQRGRRECGSEQGAFKFNILTWFN
jgi:hypothetical protein